MSETTLVKILLPESLRSHLRIELRGESLRGKIKLTSGRGEIGFSFEPFLSGENRVFFDEGRRFQACLAISDIQKLFIEGAEIDPRPPGVLLLRPVSYEVHIFEDGDLIDIDFSEELLEKSDQEKASAVSALKDFLKATKAVSQGYEDFNRISNVLDPFIDGRNFSSNPDPSYRPDIFPKDVVSVFLTDEEIVSVRNLGFDIPVFDNPVFCM